MVCVRNYDSAHTMAVSNVSVRPKSHTFATGSLDQFISLWDENIFQPVCGKLTFYVITGLFDFLSGFSFIANIL